MTAKVYCYHCMTYHAPELMRQIVISGRVRWRCIRSIDATHNSTAERDAFGRRQSELNQLESRSRRDQSGLGHRAPGHPQPAR